MNRPDHSPHEVPAFRIRAPGDEPRLGSEVESPTLPLPPPRDAAELERLLDAVASTPSGERQQIVDTLAAFTDGGAVADLLHDALFELPASDLGRHLMLLAVIGELRHESSIPVLERFVWLSDEAVLRADSHSGPASESSEVSSEFLTGGALQARAAEMLIWVTRGDFPEGIRRILGEHPALNVRVATIDACAYAADDDPQVLRSLRELVRGEDQWAVGLPRRTAGVDPDEFDALVERHQAEFASAPELPQRREPDREDGDDVR